MPDKVDAAYHYLKNKIVYGEIKPLQDISEVQIKEELGLSRTPIREAFLRLENEGFVYIYPRKGIIATEINADLASELFTIRELLEPQATAMARNNLRREWLLNMRDIYEKDINEYSIADKTRYFNLDNEMHHTMIQSCCNRFIINTLGVVLDHIQRLRYTGPRANDQIEAAVREHRGIIDALLDGTGEEIKDAVIQHLNGSKSRILSRFITRGI